VRVPLPLRLSASLVALAVTSALGPLATAPAHSTSRAAGNPAVVFDDVRASADATPGGTTVSTTFTAGNRSDQRRDARTAYLSLVAVDRDPGPQQAYRLDAVRVPALAAGDTRRVQSGTTAPRSVVQGRYHVRVCSTRIAANGTCSLSPRPSVHIGEANVELDQYDIYAGDVAPGSVTPVDVVVSNTGQSRTNWIRLAVRGGDHPDDFYVEDGTCTTWLAAGESCTAQVFFAPPEDVTGIRNSWLVAGGRGRGGAVGASLVGTVVVPAEGFSIDPAHWNYGTVAQGELARHTFVLHNNTGTDSAIHNGSIDPYENFFYDFSGPFTCAESTYLPAGGSCTVTVAFVPSAAENEYSATITLYGDFGTETASIVGNSYAPITGPALRDPDLARSFR
jgi:hypothetical protein